MYSYSTESRMCAVTQHMDRAAPPHMLLGQRHRGPACSQSNTDTGCCRYGLKALENLTRSQACCSEERRGKDADQLQSAWSLGR